MRSFRDIRGNALGTLESLASESGSSLLEYSEDADSSDCETCVMNEVCPGSKVSRDVTNVNDAEAFDLESWNPTGTPVQ
jgi:hypothetical protein